MQPLALDNRARATDQMLTITVAGVGYPAVERAALQQAQLDKRLIAQHRLLQLRHAIGQLKDLPAAEMQARLLAQTPVTDEPRPTASAGLQEGARQPLESRRAALIICC